MCGIVGIIADKPVIKELRQSLINVLYRGYDSSGVAVVVDGKMVVCKDVGYIENLPLDETLQGAIGIGHTRWATHGAVTKENCHPFTDCQGNLAVVHNGIIENWEELKEGLIKEGHVFKSETDSEVIAHLIERHADFGFEDAFKFSMRYLKGSYAIVAMHRDCPFLMVARNESPLLVGLARNQVYVASDVQAFGEDVQKVGEVAEGEVLKVGIDYALDKYISAEQFEFGDKSGYDHYMLKEINEQPEVLLKALDQDRNKLVGVALDVMRSDVILTACGTSRFAAIVGRYLISKMAKKFSDQIVGSELQYLADSFNARTLVLAVSQSGETADVLSSVRIAKEHGCRLVSIVNRRYSSLERISDVTLYMNCGAEIAVASTKAFTNELAIFYLLAFTMANEYDEGLRQLKELPDKIRECLAQAERVKEVARAIKDSEHIYYVAKGINFAVSGECALKLKEISYIHAESMAAGELKHGTLSLVNEGTPIVGLCPEDYTYQETVSNLHEAKARGGVVIGISDKNNSVFDYWLPIPKVGDIYYPMVSVIIGQQLAYYTAVARGLNPDRPKSLAKAVTVR